MWDSDACILCVGHDKLLLQTRALVLERMFHVEIASTLKKVATLPNDPYFGLILLCHSLSWQERFLASQMAREKWQDIHVLEVASSDHDAAAAEDTVLGLDGPLALIEAVCRVLRRPVPPCDDANCVAATGERQLFLASSATSSLTDHLNTQSALPEASAPSGT